MAGPPVNMFVCDGVSLCPQYVLAVLSLCLVHVIGSFETQEVKTNPKGFSCTPLVF